MTKEKPLSCDDRKAMEEEHRLKCKAVVQDGGGRVDAAVKDFFFPAIFSGGEETYKQAVWEYLFCGKVCNPRNYGEECEGCCTCDGECCGCDNTYCDDPEKCPDKHLGIGYLELVQGYWRAMQQPETPVGYKNENLKDGQLLMWDADALPCNDFCDPCSHPTLGAWVPVDKLTLVREMLKDEEIVRLLKGAINE